MSDVLFPNASARFAKRRWLLAAVALVGVLLALPLIYRGFFAAKPLNPPQLNWAGVDPAIRQVLETEMANVRGHPRSADAWGRLGCALLANLFEDEADSCFAQASALDPKNALWIYCQALIALSRDPVVGLPKLEQAVELAGDQVEGPRLRLADEYLAQGQPEKARQQFEKLLARSPQHPRALLGLARIDFQTGALDSSRRRLEVALADPRTRKPALALSAEIYERQHNTPAANRALAQMIELPDPPEWPDAYFAEIRKYKAGESIRLQSVYQLQDGRRYREALQAAQELVRDYPQSARAWAALGSVYLGQRNFSAAEQALRKSVSLEDQSPQAWINLGLCRYQQHDVADAATCFSNAIERKPDSLQAHFNLALCQAEQGNRNAAIASLRDALRCQPLSAPAHAKLGELLLEEKRYPEAIDHLQQAADLGPENTAYQKKLDEARKRRPIR
ncbi:MAG TPA: tetratricopeptide repeat protein [Gemmataceae bacterium]|nr:tetratricopeptide repeat protein [Gemmataceae bacterium]